MRHVGEQSPATATTLLTGNRPPVGPANLTGQGPDESGRFTNGQKALAGLGVGALILGAAAAIVLMSSSSHESTPTTRTSAVVVPPIDPTTTTAPPTTTTTRERPVPPPPVTTYEPPPTTTTVDPTTTAPPTTTTTAPPTTTKTTTTPRTTTGRFPWPNQDIPSMPGVPGGVSPGGARGQWYTPEYSAPTAIPQQGLP